MELRAQQHGTGERGDRGVLAIRVVVPVASLKGFVPVHQWLGAARAPLLALVVRQRLVESQSVPRDLPAVAMLPSLSAMMERNTVIPSLQRSSLPVISDSSSIV